MLEKRGEKRVETRPLEKERERKNNLPDVFLA